jgi:hypothetical protein
MGFLFLFSSQFVFCVRMSFERFSELAEDSEELRVFEKSIARYDKHARDRHFIMDEVIFCF